MAPERVHGGFGGKLRDARERRGISLREIANTTKISVVALEALERNDIARLPGGIFTRAFVRSYASEVGLEPEAAIQEFIAAFPQDSVTVGHPSSVVIEDHETLASDRQMVSTLLRVVAFSVPVVAIVLYFSLSGGRGVGSRPEMPGAPVAADAPASATATNGSLATAVPDPPARAPDGRTPTPPPADHLIVGLSVTAPSWVSATVDGLRVVERELQAGERQRFEVGRELVLTTRNAGGLALTLDGADARPLGRMGETITTRLDRTNFKDYLAPR